MYKNIIISTIFCIAAIFSVFLEEAQAMELKPEVFWQASYNGEECVEIAPRSRQCWPGDGLILSHGNGLPDGRWIFLGREYQDRKGRYVFVVHRLEKGVPEIVSLQLREESAIILDMDVAPDETVWVAGYANNQHVWPPGAVKNSYYLAQLSLDGSVLSERTFDRGDFRLIKDISVLPDGRVLAFGSESKGWIGVVSAQGRLENKFVLGHDKGGHLAVSKESGLVAGIIGNDAEGANYQEDVVVWPVDFNGKAGARKVIDHKLNNKSSAHYGLIQAIETTGGYYILSHWTNSITKDRSELKELTVTKTDMEGNVIWQKKLSDTIGAQDGAARHKLCQHPDMISLRGEDLLVACSMDKKIQMYRFVAATGSYRQDIIEKPACAADSPLALMLYENKEGQIFIAGSRPDGNVGGGCSWVGRLSLSK